MKDQGEAGLMRALRLRKHYGKDEGLVRAVDEVDLEITSGETLAVMGPSGCGKSTLLHLLGGLDRPSGGELWLAGRRIDRLGERPSPICGDARSASSSRPFISWTSSRRPKTSSFPRSSRAARRARRAGGRWICSTRLASPIAAAICRLRFPAGSASASPLPGHSINDPLVVLADEPTGNLDSAATLEVLRLFEPARMRQD